MSVTAVARPAERSIRDSPPAFAAAPVAAIAATLVALELAVAARYGFHRDELYFLACARHLAWGYVDQPPFVPAVARLATVLFGTSPVSLRFFPALAGASAVLCAGLIARELGGNRRAQVFAALASATSAQVLATVHLLSTAAFDLFFWSVVSLLVIRLLRTRDQRLWLAIGAVTGIALLNKYNVAFLVAALVLGLVAGGQSWALRGWWPWVGGAIALVIWAPNLVWNAQHDWAALAMLHALHDENSSLGASISFIPSQALIVGPLLLVFWLAGLRLLFKHPFARPIAVAYVSLFIVDVLAGAKPYYLGGIYFALFGAGGVWFEQRTMGSGGDHRARRMARLMVLGAAVALPLTLPVLPVTAQAKSAWEGNINKDLSATVGWKRVVRQIDAIARALPPSERAHVVVFTGDYGAAGAVDLYGGQFRLPRAISGHNNYWWWGPQGATNGATTIAVNLDKSYLQTIFGSVTPAGSVDTGDGIWTEERGAPIFVCRDQLRSWAQLWPGAKHYG